MATQNERTEFITPPDQAVLAEDWSLLVKIRPMPEIDFDALLNYHLGRVLNEMKLRNIPACVLISPLSLRYTADIRL